MKNKKGYYFSLDAFIALMIILGVVLFIKPHSVTVTQEISVQHDLLSVLSNLQIGEIDNSYVKGLIASGNITNLNQSVLEQIGEFYATSDPNDGLILQSILDDLGLDENIGLYFNGQEVATSESITFGSAESVWTSRQVISGISDAGGSAQGFSSRAFIFSENNVDYIYFGGYVGDGNITLDLGQGVISVKIEGVFANGFNASVNGGSLVNHFPTSNVPYEFTITSGFVSGSNSLRLSSSNNLYIAGGFVKVFYNNSSPVSTINKHKLPGIEGLINIYDSVFIPGTINNMSVFLHYNSSYDLFLTIGNKTVYNGSGSDVQVTLDNATLAGLLDYSMMNGKTIPIRLGLKDVSLTGNLSTVSDIFSVTDLSSSMNENIGSGNTKIIDIVKVANKEFIKIIVNESITEADNRAGLVGFNHHQRFYEDDYYHNLSVDNGSLSAKIDGWTTSAGTCICCGINKAVQGFLDESNENRSKVMVVMSDGVPTGEGCIEQGNVDPIVDAIQAACDAKNNHNISVYVIGFGDNVDESTLQAIASCGGGNYYFGSVQQLVDIYKQAAQDIIRAIYDAQTVISESIQTLLFSDSYVSVDYEKTIPYGLIITTESPEFGSNAPIGNFSLPFDAIPYEARVVSYSGSRWTSLVESYNNISSTWESIFNLSEYNSSFVSIGDPYAVDIPSAKLRKGENSVRVFEGLSPGNVTDGSQYNKVIYSVIKNVSGFSPILPSADGCIWTIEFEDSTTETMSFPSDYTGTDFCTYNSSIGLPTFAIYNQNDAIDVSIYSLLSALDLNFNGKIETKFTENDLTISSTQVSGIPFVWETEAQVRVWR